MEVISIFTMVYKPTYNWGGHHLVVIFFPPYCWLIFYFGWLKNLHIFTLYLFFNNAQQKSASAMGTPVKFWGTNGTTNLVCDHVI